MTRDSTPGKRPVRQPAGEVAQGRTTPSQEGEQVGRLPHERDESDDSQAASADQRKVGEQALADVASGKVDTDRGPVADSTYRRLKKGA